MRLPPPPTSSSWLAAVMTTPGRWWSTSPRGWARPSPPCARSWIRSSSFSAAGSAPAHCCCGPSAALPPRSSRSRRGSRPACSATRRLCAGRSPVALHAARSQLIPQGGAARRAELIGARRAIQNRRGETRMAAIEIQDVSKRYRDGTVAVRDLSLQIADGEFTVLVGPSGCGKTTLLRMIAGLEEISDGHDLDRRARGQRPHPQGSRHRHGLPELRALSAHDGARRTWASRCAARRCPPRRSAARCSTPPSCWASPTSSSASPATSPAASASGSRWAARSCATPRPS